MKNDRRQIDLWLKLMTAQKTISPSDRCPTCGRRKKRNTDQNARYWSLVHKVADQYHPDGQAFSGTTWHLQFKSYWLGCDDYRLPTGEVMTIPRSTADLTVEEFGEYMDRVEAWAATRGVWLEE